MSNDNVVTLRGKRPLSVWVLCVLNGILAAFLIGASLKAEDLGYSGGQAAFVGIVGLAISIAAHAAWWGYRWGRLILVSLLTLLLGLTIVREAIVISYGAEADYFGGIVREAFLRAGLSLAWLSANYIFLFGKRARAFYG